MRYSASMEIIPFVTLDNQESRTFYLVYRNICFVFIVHVFSPPLLFYLYNLWITNWVHSYNFYLHNPYIFIIIVQYACSRTFRIINWVHSYNFYLLKPYIFIIIVQYACSRTFWIHKLSSFLQLLSSQALYFYHHCEICMF